MELNLSRDVKDNKTTWENASLLLNKMGDMITKDGEKARTFSVFFGLQVSQILEIRDWGKTVEED